MRFYADAISCFSLSVLSVHFFCSLQYCVVVFELACIYDDIEHCLQPRPLQCHGPHQIELACTYLFKCSISLPNIVYMPQLYFLYKLNYPSVNSMSERQRPAAHRLGRLKIVPTIKNLYDIQYQCVDELSYLI